MAGKGSVKTVKQALDQIDEILSRRPKNKQLSEDEQEMPEVQKVDKIAKDEDKVVVTCTHCGLSSNGMTPEDMKVIFCVDKHTISGFRSLCKACKREQSRKAYAAPDGDKPPTLVINLGLIPKDRADALVAKLRDRASASIRTVNAETLHVLLNALEI